MKTTLIRIGNSEGREIQKTRLVRHLGRISDTAARHVLSVLSQMFAY